MKNPKISVIVPVYNVEQYLCRCVDSILAQTFPDFELLLIDDGSKDRSGEICDEYAGKDERVRVFHKENGGVSSARNLGIDNAKGEWISFIDADDRILPEFLQSLIETADESDELIVGGNTYFGEEEGETVPPENIVVKREHFKDYIFNDSEWTWQRIFYVVWGKLFRLNIIKENKLKFDINMIRSEDTTFMLIYMTKIESVKFCSVKNYSYRYELSNKPYYNFTIDKFILQQKAYLSYMNVISQRDIGSFQHIINKSRTLCFALFLSSLLTKKDFVNGIKGYLLFEKDNSYLYSDLRHRIYYKLLFTWPSLGYIINKFKIK